MMTKRAAALAVVMNRAETNETKEQQSAEFELFFSLSLSTHVLTHHR